MVSSTFTFSWLKFGVIVTDLEINLLFEIFGPLPTSGQFTLRGDSLIGLGKSRVMIQNQDELRVILWQYIDGLSLTQQRRVQDLIGRWSEIDTKVIKFDTAERVKFRTSAPEEERYLIKQRLQTYIPIFTQQEIDNYQETGNTDSSGNTIHRG